MLPAARISAGFVVPDPALATETAWPILIAPVETSCTLSVASGEASTNPLSVRFPPVSVVRVTLDPSNIVTAPDVVLTARRGKVLPELESDTAPPAWTARLAALTAEVSVTAPLLASTTAAEVADSGPDRLRPDEAPALTSEMKTLGVAFAVMAPSWRAPVPPSTVKAPVSVSEIAASVVLPVSLVSPKVATAAVASLAVGFSTATSIIAAVLD